MENIIESIKKAIAERGEAIVCVGNPSSYLSRIYRFLEVSKDKDPWTGKVKENEVLLDKNGWAFRMNADDLLCSSKMARLHETMEAAEADRDARNKASTPPRAMAISAIALGVRTNR